MGPMRLVFTGDRAMGRLGLVPVAGRGRGRAVGRKQPSAAHGPQLVFAPRSRFEAGLDGLSPGSPRGCCGSEPPGSRKRLLAASRRIVDRWTPNHDLVPAGEPPASPINRFRKVTLATRESLDRDPDLAALSQRWELPQRMNPGTFGFLHTVSGEVISYTEYLCIASPWFAIMCTM